MKSNKSTHTYDRNVIEKRRLDFDLAYCKVTYDSQEGRERCYAEAIEASENRNEQVISPD
ncbi:MAG: hypothetical protein D3926_20670 [Desulfobacteraceae bacterium]|nr:MAG: hypothetical protein D3926_20670 [Desulfobacteraceae bacterium]